MSSVGTTRAHGGASTTRSRQRVPVSTRLPVSLTRFIGREAELAEAAVLLPANHLLTLTGAGGAGKTRLAMQLADRLAGGNPDGVWFVDFSPRGSGPLPRLAQGAGVARQLLARRRVSIRSCGQPARVSAERENPCHLSRATWGRRRGHLGCAVVSRGRRGRSLHRPRPARAAAVQAPRRRQARRARHLPAPGRWRSSRWVLWKVQRPASRRPPHSPTRES